MVDVWARLEPHLTSVQKPARYIGCELGAEVPPADPSRVGWLLVYPDTYEIGLPNQGLQILYEILNERPDALAERSYAPWTDLEEVMRREDIPLFSVDTHRSADEFDVVAFNLSAELVYTNVLNCLDLGGIPVRSADRTVHDPLVGAGGHATYNPEPLADFLDFVVLGDGEEVVGEMNAVLVEWKAAPGTDRRDLLRRLAGIEGVYVPSLYEARYLPDGRLEATVPIESAAPALVEKRTIADLADWPYPKQQLVPLTEVVHDRLNVEVFRGCTRGCRFCQAGHDHPPGPRATGRSGHVHGAAGTAPHGLRRGRPDQPLHRRLLGHRGRRHHRHGRLGGLRQRVGEPPEPARRRLHRRRGRPDPEGPPHRPHLRPRGGDVAHAPGHQQAHHRGRPLQPRSTRRSARGGGA